MKPLFSELDRRITLTLGELAELTDIPTTTLREWSRKGQIPGMFRPHKGCRHRFRRDAIEQWWVDMQQV